MSLTHYRCRNCDAFFPEDSAHFRHVHVPSEAWGQRDEHTLQVIYRCCDCGSESIEEVAGCVVCGRREAAQGTDACDPCIDAAEAEWDRRVAKVRHALPGLPAPLGSHGGVLR